MFLGSISESLAQAIRQLLFRPACVIILTLSYQQNITANQKDETNQKGTDLLGQEGQAPIPRAAFPVKQESGFVVGDISTYRGLEGNHSIYSVVSPPDRPGLKTQPMGLGDNTMIRQQHRILCLLVVASLISFLAGCASQRTNSQFTVRVSGNTDGLAFDGQCTAQKAGFWPGESVAQGLDVKGTVYSVSQPQDYETSGYFIYCAVANQSATGTITVELLQDGNVVASAQSTSPDKPAILEFGQKP